MSKSNYVHFHGWSIGFINGVVDIRVLLEENLNDLRIFRRELPEGNIEIVIRKYLKISWTSSN